LIAEPRADPTAAAHIDDRRRFHRLAPPPPPPSAERSFSWAALPFVPFEASLVRLSLHPPSTPSFDNASTRLSVNPPFGVHSEPPEVEQVNISSDQRQQDLRLLNLECVLPPLAPSPFPSRRPTAYLRPADGVISPTDDPLTPLTCSSSVRPLALPGGRRSAVSRPCLTGHLQPEPVFPLTSAPPGGSPILAGEPP
jgi:hypothetical protein